MPSNDIEENIRTVRRGPRFFGDSSDADAPQSTSTTSDIEARAEEILKKTSSPSARSTTRRRTGFSGEEPLEYVLSLPSPQRKLWVIKRLMAFREAIVQYADIALREKSLGKTVSEAEWTATAETGGLTRAVPMEREVFEWILETSESSNPSSESRVPAPPVGGPGSVTRVGSNSG